MVFLFTAHLTVLKRSAENGNLLVREYTNPHKIFRNSPLQEVTRPAPEVFSGTDGIVQLFIQPSQLRYLAKTG